MQIDDFARIVARLHGTTANVDGAGLGYPFELRWGNDFSVRLVVDQNPFVIARRR